MQTAFEGGGLENCSPFMGSRFKQQLLGSQSCCWLKSAWCELEKVQSLGQMQPGPQAQRRAQVGELGGTQDRLSWSLHPCVDRKEQPCGWLPVCRAGGLCSARHSSQTLSWLSQARVPEGSRLQSPSADHRCLLCLISCFVSLAGTTADMVGQSLVGSQSWGHKGPWALSQQGYAPKAQ